MSGAAVDTDRLAVVLADSDESARSNMKRALRDWGAAVHEASDEQQAIALLKSAPDLLITDLRLAGGGSGLRLATLASTLRPSPIVVAVSDQATPVEAFQLAQAGTAAYLPKPLDLATFVATIESVLAQPPCIEPQIAMQVGRVPYFEVLARVRRTMLEQALAQAGGNRIRAAERLKLTRQAVQQMIRSFAT